MGIRYRFGLFQQKIVNGYQTEVPDTWLDAGYPWETAKRDESIVVKFGGYVDREYRDGKVAFQYKGYDQVLAVPYDVPVVGYGGKTVNPLRLWYAQPLEERFDLAAFNRGDYAAAVKHRRRLPAFSIRMTVRWRAKSCGCSRNTCWWPPVWETWFGDTSGCTGTGSGL